METAQMETKEIEVPQVPDLRRYDGVLPTFRPDLAFPKLTEDMVARLRPYGSEETFPPGAVLFSQGDRLTDLFVVLDGGIEIAACTACGEVQTFVRHGAFDFAGELNLLTSQAALAEARTSVPSRLLRICREDMQRLMRAEGDIANLIVQAAIWRRIGILQKASSGVVLMGDVDCAEMTHLRQFFARNTYPYRVVDSAAAHTRLDESSLPAVVLAGGRILSRPTIPELADELGITELPDPTITYDVAVVGAGPSGLAASVYAASEGLSTIVIEGLAPGGQAGTSSKIENYLGFPTGISGQQLASRAQLQALKFGVHFAISRQIVSAEQIDGKHKLTLEGGIPVFARAVVVASGAQYRKLSVANYSTYENRGVYYAATALESMLCHEREIIVVGGGNSAGQAAVYLSGHATHVHHLVRSTSLTSSMSQYLISRIESSPRITVHTDSEIESLEGDYTLERVAWVNHRTGERPTKPIRNVFVMIGAEPNSGWLFGTVKLDKKGFVITGEADAFENTPYATNVPGIYAVGDVRCGSVKRIASAVGEGSVVISDVHRYLAKRAA